MNQLRTLFRRVRKKAKFAKIAKSFTPASDLLVLTNGRSGSWSVTSAARESGFEGRVLHLHLLNDRSIRHATDRIKNSAKPELDGHHLLSLFVGEKIRSSKDRLRIITLTREPISRCLSFVFKDAKRQGLVHPAAGPTIDNMVQSALSKLSPPSTHNDPGIWFTSELLEPLGIDVLSREFNSSEGGAIQEWDRASVLVMRMEDFHKEETNCLLSSFVGKECDLNRNPQNLGRNDANGDKYAELTSKFKLPKEIIDSTVKTHFFQRFYADLEQATRLKFTDNS